MQLQRGDAPAARRLEAPPSHLCVRSYDLQPDAADADCGGAIDAKAATYTMFTQVRPLTFEWLETLT